ncbi:MAG: hypothetical protein MJ138_06570 [Kiritimatiellae bacterium]|nr:hypothetical protein [Kiritimatiellia bacterium]
MDKKDIAEIAQAIARLGLWKKVAGKVWAVTLETETLPFLVTAAQESGKNPIAGRLLVFRGFDAFRDFRIFTQNPNLGVAMSPIDFEHWEVVGLASGGAELYAFAPGFVPVPPPPGDAAFLAPVLYESYGILMRLEEEPDLPLEFKDEASLFARREGLDGKWRDAPLKAPGLPHVLYVERVALAKADCEAAAKLQLAKDETWEIDFLQSAVFRTTEARPRILYLFAGVDAATGRRVLWDRMGVGSGGLKGMWESLATRLLKAFLASGRVPGAIHVRTPRLARFVRPLGLQIPFKMVQHAKLPTLDGVLSRAATDKTI